MAGSLIASGCDVAFKLRCALSPRLAIMQTLDRVRPASVRMVSLIVAIAWAVYVATPGRQIRSISEEVIGPWMLALAVFVAPSVLASTTVNWQRFTNIACAVHWLSWALLITFFEQYELTAVVGQWVLAGFALAAVVHSIVIYEDERREGDHD